MRISATGALAVPLRSLFLSISPGVPPQRTDQTVSFRRSPPARVRQRRSLPQAARATTTAPTPPSRSARPHSSSRSPVPPSSSAPCSSHELILPSPMIPDSEPDSFFRVVVVAVAGTRVAARTPSTIACDVVWFSPLEVSNRPQTRLSGLTVERIFQTRRQTVVG